MTMDGSPFYLQSEHNDMFDLPHGFLPAADPITSLPAEYAPWESIALQLPKWLATTQLRSAIEALPPFDLTGLSNAQMLERAMLILSYLGHAYVWDSHFTPAKQLPENLAVAWHRVAAQLGRPPILSYASYALYNWYRIDPKQPIELGNIALLQNFWGGVDEEWFILIHVDIEAKAIPLLQQLQSLQLAATKQDAAVVLQGLQVIIASLTAINATFERMPEYCDPFIYYQRVRPFIHGWKDNPALPKGLLYTGVSEYSGPMQFKGETGAQSTIIPALDALLDVKHEDTPLRQHLDEMRLYMPLPHRFFLEYLEEQGGIRSYVQSCQTECPEMSNAYNQCVQLIYEFRTQHVTYAANYIQKQNQMSSANSTEVGTGGTPFMAYLREHQQETEANLIG